MTAEHSMNFSPTLAHGALGAFDELLLVAVAAAFVIIMAVSWLRTRSQPDPPSEETSSQDAGTSSEHRDDSEEHFRLD
ncbi:MAG: hypothetical protein JNL42_08100 [Anaerolineae bacterium]|nr:hypothetical protein [Anaerolineae bacterium]